MARSKTAGDYSVRSLVFIHPSDEIYGADRMLLAQLEAVPKSVDVEVWLPNDLEHPRIALCEVLETRGVRARHLPLPILRRAYRTPRGMFSLAFRSTKLYRELRAVVPDIVYCTTSAASLGIPVARMARVRTVIGHVQEIWTQSDRRSIGPILRAGHRIIAISEAVAQSMPRDLQDRAVVVPNGTPDPGAVAAVDEKAGPLTFVVASRWNGWKGHGTLLRAWDEVPEAKLIVLGGPPLSGERTDVGALVAALKNPSSVQLTGEVDDPSPYLDESDVVVVPSDAPEPFGLVAIEAFARGRPVIASAGGGLLDVVTDGEDGWLFPPGDAPALATILRSLDREMVEQAGARARKTYESRYTTSEYARRWRAAVGMEKLVDRAEDGGSPVEPDAIAADLL